MIFVYSSSIALVEIKMALVFYNCVRESGSRAVQLYKQSWDIMLGLIA